MSKSKFATKYTDAKAMKVHQLRLAGTSWADIHRQMNIAVSTAISWQQIVLGNPELLNKAETEKHPGEKPKKNGTNVDRAVLQSLTDATKEENEYLRWWNQGERRGWVDRLLREIQK